MQNHYILRHSYTRAEVSNALPSAHDRGRLEEDLAALKTDIKAAETKMDHSNREAVMPDGLHKKHGDLTTKHELRGLTTRDEFWRLITSDEVWGLVLKPPRPLPNYQIPNFSLAILAPSTLALIFLIATSLAKSGLPCFGFASILKGLNPQSSVAPN